MTLTTFGIARLKPALPEFDRSSVILDTVQRDLLIREVRGPGTLVPIDINWVTTEVGGQVVEVFVERGIEVTPDTVLLKLHDAQMDRAIRDAKRSVDSATSALERFKLQLHSQHLDRKVSIATARANYEEAETQAELNETLTRRGLISPRQWRLSKDRAGRNLMLFEIQLERATNSQQTQEIQLTERQAAIKRADDYLDERLEYEKALVVKAGTYGVLQQLGASADGRLEIGQRVSRGAVVAIITNPERLKAELQVSQTQARDVVVGQTARIDTRNGIIEGRVIRIDPAVQNQRVTVDVELQGELPKGARPDLSVEGLIEVARLEDVLFVRKPVLSRQNGRMEVFRLAPDGQTAVRTTVEFGLSSVHAIQVETGLRVGDEIVVSDTTRWKSFDRVMLK